MTTMTKGGNIAVAAPMVRVTLFWTGGPEVPDVDGSALLLQSNGKVSSDADMVFYNQPQHPSGAVRHAGTSTAAPGETACYDVIDINLSQIPSDVERIALSASADGGTFGEVPGLRLVLMDLTSGAELATFPMTADTETAFVTGELYRRDGAWKFRAVGQGYDSGLAGLATDFGIDVGEEMADASTAPSAPSAPAVPAGPVLPPPSWAAPAAPPAAAAPPVPPPDAPSGAPSDAPRHAAPEPVMAEPPAPAPPPAPSPSPSGLDLGQPSPPTTAIPAPTWDAIPPPPPPPAVPPPPPPPLPPVASLPPQAVEVAAPPPTAPPIPDTWAAPVPVSAPLMPPTASTAANLDGGPVSLVKNQRVHLSRSDSGPLTRVVMTLGWEPIPDRGAVDLDASVIAFDAAGEKLCIVWYQHQNEFNGALQHAGDNKGEGQQGLGGEQVWVDLARLPDQVNALVFTISSFKGHTFTDLTTAFCTLSDDQNVEVVRYDLTDTQPSTAVLMAVVRRTGPGTWSARAIGEFHDCRTVRKLVGPAARQSTMA